MKKLFFLFVIICNIHAGASEYVKPAHISEEVWAETEPKLIPFNHPAKKKLDKIFSKASVLDNMVNLHKAGFEFIEVRNPVHTLIGKHTQLKGYIVKLFTNMQQERKEWLYWLRRIKGAELIAEAIEEKGYGHMMKVPKKWLYLIEANHDPDKKTFVLVAEDMKLFDDKVNKKLWKNRMTHELLFAIYDMMESLGLYDSNYIDNIPFSKDFRIAFIDTEHYLDWPIAYRKLNLRLSDEIREYWLQITGQQENSNNETPGP